MVMQLVSQLALYHFLKSLGKTVKMVSPNYLQEFLLWMDDVELISVFIKDRKEGRQIVKEADLIIMLDFNQSNRLGEVEDLVINSGAKKVVIDHHLDPQGFVDLIISDPSKCSTAELIYEIVTELNGGKFTEIAFTKAIYVGIITDTGNFEHGAYSSETFRIVADLLDTGINKAEILNNIYNNFSADRMKLQGYALNQRMEVLPEFKTAYISLSKADLKLYNHCKRGYGGICQSASFYKRNSFFSLNSLKKKTLFKLSFRSKGQFPSNEFASLYFNGGGHMNASGGEYYDSLENYNTVFP